MKHSIRTRFTLGMFFLFIIISVLSVFSGYYMSRLSKKTDAILKENYLSVVYAREMSAGIMTVNQEISTAFLKNRNTDHLIIAKEFKLIDKYLDSEKNNITEPGEDKLVAVIENDYFEYRDSVLNIIKSPLSEAGVLYLQNRSGELYQQLLVLSQMNGKAIEVKTDDAKSFSKSAMGRMTILATICFLVALGFTYGFASYFNQRFFQLYNGIKEIVSSNFDQHLFFDGNDEFYEISLLLNEMAEKLKNNKQKMSVTLLKEPENNISSGDVEELRKMLLRLKSMEDQAVELISKFEKK
jgi:two-component system, NtrC family, sensor histidine kinase KinB